MNFKISRNQLFKVCEILNISKPKKYLDGAYPIKDTATVNTILKMLFDLNIDATALDCSWFVESVETRWE